MNKTLTSIVLTASTILAGNALGQGIPKPRGAPEAPADAGKPKEEAKPAEPAPKPEPKTPAAGPAGREPEAVPPARAPEPTPAGPAPDRFTLDSLVPQFVEYAKNGTAKVDANLKEVLQRPSELIAGQIPYEGMILQLNENQANRIKELLKRENFPTDASSSDYGTTLVAHLKNESRVIYELGSYTGSSAGEKTKEVIDIAVAGYAFRAIALQRKEARDSRVAKEREKRKAAIKRRQGIAKNFDYDAFKAELFSGNLISKQRFEDLTGVGGKFAKYVGASVGGETATETYVRSASNNLGTGELAGAKLQLLWTFASQERPGKKDAMLYSIMVNRRENTP